MAQNSLALEIAGLSFNFGKKAALDDVSFAVAKGQFKVLLGPNGAGKTTLFSLVTRLYVSARGNIRVNGADLRDAPLLALAQMGIVFQQPTLDLDLNVRQNLLYHAALHGMEKNTRANAWKPNSLDSECWSGKPKRCGSLTAGIGAASK